MFCEGTMFWKDASILNLQFSICMVFVPRFYQRIEFECMILTADRDQTSHKQSAAIFFARAHWPCMRAFNPARFRFPIDTFRSGHDDTSIHRLLVYKCKYIYINMYMYVYKVYRYSF